VTEAGFQKQIIDLARMSGWKVFHARPARFADGRVATHFTGDAGFPDLVMVHPRKGFIIAELKSDTGRTTPEQVAWLEASGHWVEAYLWRPKDWPMIIERLRR
jgi:hypothetical protein